MTGQGSARHSGHKGHSGFTLMELMVVIVLIGILTALIIPEMKGSFQDALLRSTSRDLIGVFDLAYSRAVSLNQLRRVRLDEKTGQFLVEKRVMDGGEEIFVPADDLPGSKGKLDSRITVEFRRPAEMAANADASAADASDENAPAPPANPTAATTATAADESPDDPVIHFYPDGTADAGEIVLRDRDGFKLVLRMNPITARLRIVDPDSEVPK